MNNDNDIEIKMLKVKRANIIKTRDGYREMYNMDQFTNKTDNNLTANQRAPPMDTTIIIHKPLYH